jgi:P pilus assembly chaperone PapD
MVAKWLYYKGKMVGMWDQADNTTLVFKNQREEIKVQTSAEPPEAAQIQKWVDDGIIEAAKAKIANN